MPDIRESMQRLLKEVSREEAQAQAGSREKPILLTNSNNQGNSTPASSNGQCSSPPSGGEVGRGAPIPSIKKPKAPRADHFG